jgi:hypothetical protein
MRIPYILNKLPIRNLILFIFFLFQCASSIAQDDISYVPEEQIIKKHQFSFSVGSLSNEQIYNIFDDLDIYSQTNGNIYTENIRSKGALMFGYKYFIKPNWSLGVNGGIDNADGIILNVNDASIGDYERRSYTFSIESDYNYYNTKYFQIYCTAGVGFSNSSDKYIVKVPGFEETIEESNNHFNFQITPVGFRLGNIIALNAEMGLGYKGIFSIGVSSRF